MLEIKKKYWVLAKKATKLGGEKLKYINFVCNIKKIIKSSWTLYNKSAAFKA